MSGNIKKAVKKKTGSWNLKRAGLLVATGGLSEGYNLAKWALTPEEAKAEDPGDLGVAEAQRQAELQRQKMEFETKRREWSAKLRELQWAGPSG